MPLRAYICRARNPVVIQHQLNHLFIKTLRPANQLLCQELASSFPFFTLTPLVALSLSPADPSERCVADATSARPPGPGHPRHPGAVGLGHKRDGAPRLERRHQDAPFGAGQGLDGVRTQRELVSLLLYHAVVDYTPIGSLKTSNALISTLATNGAWKYDFTMKTTSDSIALDTGVDSSLDEMLRQRFMVY
ncbi:uncharacterized protein LOC104451221 [Eucalyptus grandis]|uniref:uncharacterized protein LOC104451221 n=1 Tax=Eucalyptus grandis TaxID=71139 RepID=UPI00192E7F46|nr:uncharacterized protein LOC104451221 [Eucalyptus grandis]